MINCITSLIPLPLKMVSDGQYAVHSRRHSVARHQAQSHSSATRQAEDHLGK